MCPASCLLAVEVGHDGSSSSTLSHHSLLASWQGCCCWAARPSVSHRAAGNKPTAGALRGQSVSLGAPTASVSALPAGCVREHSHSPRCGVLGRLGAFTGWGLSTVHSIASTTEVRLCVCMESRGPLDGLL